MYRAAELCTESIYYTENESVYCTPKYPNTQYKIWDILVYIIIIIIIIIILGQFGVRYTLPFITV